MAVQYTIESFVVGFIYLITALLVAAAYIPCLLVLIKDKELRQNSCIKMMLHLGLSDMINIVQHTILALIIIFYPKTPINYWFNKILFGTTAAYAWHPYIFLCLFISINRCVTLCFPKYDHVLFGPKATNIWIAAAWFKGLVWHAVQMSPKMGYLYYPASYNMYIDFSSEWGMYWHHFGWWEGTVVMLSAGLIYIIISILLKLQHQDMSVGIDAERRAEHLAREKLILKQAAAICVFCVFLNQFWSWLSVLPPMPYMYQFANWLWITNSAINPIVYLTLNKTMKMKVKKLMGFKTAAVRSTTRPATSAQGRMRQAGPGSRQIQHK